jgi:uncharacterized damage-inducible protein DinB
MNIVKYNQENLNELRSLVESLRDEQFKMKVDILSNASIGEHVRHILEFYVCLLRAHATGVVSYDERERNPKIETDRSFALSVIDNIVLALTEIKSDHPLKLRADFSPDGENDTILETSVFRELAYDLEHSIHHQALIKVGLAYLGEEGVLNEDFGVAPSTVRHRKLNDQRLL